MWIRTQSKDEVIEVKNVMVDENEVSAGSANITEDDYAYTLGVYETDKRANEVFMDICKAIAKDRNIFYMPEK